MDKLSTFRDASIGLPALQELATHDQWVMWRYKRIEVPGKPVHLTKIPVNANNGANAMTNEARTWASFKKCYDGAVKRGLAGVGYVLNETDGFSGLDLDKCISDDGVIEDWAAEIVALGETYCEISPSKKGLRFFIRGKVEHATKCDPARVELYGNKRFLTVTGYHVEGAPEEINPAPRTIQAVLARVEQFRGEAEKVVGEAREARKLEQEDEPPYIVFTRRQRMEDEAKRRRGEYVGWLKNAPKPAAVAGGNYFRNVNDKACAELGRWVQALFPQAKRSGTGWRVSSKSLGRSLEEDISITAEGIVDFGVADMGDANQGKRTPINLAMEWGGHPDPTSAARWLCEQLSVTPESLGWEDKSGRPEPRRVHQAEDGTWIDTETGEVLSEKTGANGADGDSTMPEHLARVPGVLNDLVEWVMAGAQHPSRVGGLMSALATVATFSGRVWAGPTRAALHLYTAGIGPSGCGKDRVLSSTLKLMIAFDMGQFVFDEPMSQTALMNSISETPLCLSQIDEIGMFFGRILNKRASSFEKGVEASMTKAWSKSFEPLITPRYASRPSVTVFNPAFNCMGVSTPDKFWGALGTDAITSGFLNRWIMFELPVVKRRTPTLTEDEINCAPDHVMMWLAKIYGGGRSRMNGWDANVRDPGFNDPPLVVPWDSRETEKLWDDYAATIQSRFAGSEFEALSPLLARAAENALRVATIYALAENIDAPRVTYEAVQWATGLLSWCADRTASQAVRFMAENENQENANRIKRAMSGFPDMIATRSQLLSKLNNIMRKNDFDNLITMMIDAGQVEELSDEKKKSMSSLKKTRGPKPAIYRLVPEKLNFQAA
ncbi:DUF3987 domain-containing protein [Rhodoblastus acidophilus]|uniref:DUF3987 domain-containing protein n=1 Tax=Rhodoblastus acidophilus TaxID=1074 RepID=A0A6N8DLA1_RHOAC|nr:DUF3987 domain-containing protein [Rhodoblastus acidophilus]MCW2275102.1 hypothetical protein [Rhodoblastus acidophilus]MTV31372.1 DUF3987 domain-containing protein [Rhodoblastus acidophilus]